MLSARTLAIHNDVRNNNNQELNLSVASPAFPFSGRAIVATDATDYDTP
jgi:hypothetical protein